MPEALSNLRELVTGYETSQTMNREKRWYRGHIEDPLECVQAERSPIWTVGADIWEKREEDVKAPKETHDTQNDAADCAVDRKEEVDETCEEEEYSYVEQDRKETDDSREGECLYALEKVLPCTDALV